MICDMCGKDAIVIKEVEIEEKKYLVEACTNCENCDIIYLHKNGVSEFLIKG